jgi:hypothetical protein
MTNTWGGAKQTTQDPEGNHLTVQIEVKSGKKKPLAIVLTPQDRFEPY